MKLFVVMTLLTLSYAGGHFTAGLSSRAAAERRTNQLRTMALTWERTATQCDQSGNPDAADALRNCAFTVRQSVDQ